MPGAYHFSKEQEDKMFELYKGGTPLLDIGKLFNVGYKPVQRILIKKYGVSFDRPCCKVGDIVNGWEIIKIEMRHNFTRQCGRNDQVAMAKSVVPGYDIERDFLLSKFNTGKVTPPDNNKNIFPPNKRHGESKTRLHKAWCAMMNRCNSAGDIRFEGTSYQKYGVQYCEEWKVYENFRDWALANGYADDLSIDRIDFKGNYEPSNCRWVDSKTQNRNRGDNRYVELTAFGECKSIYDWCDDERCLVNLKALRYRIDQGWDHERAIIEPSGSPIRAKGTINNFIKEKYKEIYDSYYTDYWQEEFYFELNKVMVKK